MKKFILFYLVIFTSVSAFSQSNQFFIKAGTQFPFQHNVGSEFVLNNRVGFQLQYGLITKPYQGNVSKVVSYFEDNKNLLQLIDNSFQSGTVLGAGFNYHFNKNYIGGFGQYISLRNTSTATELLSAYYNLDFSFLSFITGPIDLTLQSQLFNAGILFGRRFLFKNPALQLHLELGLSKNFASNNKVQSNRQGLDNLGFVQNVYDKVDRSLQDTFRSYVFIPTFNIYLVYDLMER